MNRRTANKLLLTAGVTAVAGNSLMKLVSAQELNPVTANEKIKTISKKTRKSLMKIGCSGALCEALNCQFGHPMQLEERAASSLAGGILRAGHQCGMLWGAALAVGAESFRRYQDPNQATAIAITTTQQIQESFIKRTKTPNCREITGYDFTKKFDMFKLMLKHVFFIRPCFDLAEDWTPEAIEAAAKGLSNGQIELNYTPISCASVIARKLGASEAEAVMVAGFAGGIGLSGNGCGALGAAIWLKTLEWCRKNPDQKDAFFNEYAQKTFDAFREATGAEMVCHKISGQRFPTIEAHSEFIKNGGCEKVIQVLAQA